ncbi:uncharacterized protein LOC111325131 [Stylophora pistillata]|uniref:uncharacterized protein LOC111325131 n=1 Tax=Stylophora pistillata TaxID=50429 RepID=UPI000C03F57E|nr:uncharacterized protein LOC111325131 [Stylophora pistillata]
MDQGKQVKTETLLDSLVRQLSVYAVAAMGLFLIAKEYFSGSLIVCQPINRGVKTNLSYSQSQADYDKAYCLMSMIDFRENLIIASGSEPNTIPGVTIMGIKSEEEKIIYQNYLPFALVIQAALCCIPIILWHIWASDILRTCIRFVVDSSSKIFPGVVDSSHSSVKKDQSFELRMEYLGAQVELWEGRKFLLRVYTTKLMLSLGIFIFIVTFYVAYPQLNYANFQGYFVCHVHKQTLVTCVFPDIDLFKLAWIVNIVLVDISIVIVVLQLLNVAFCLQRKKTFFSYFMGIEERKISLIPNDLHLISHFCYENAGVMCPSMMHSSFNLRKTMQTPLISLGSSEEELHSPNSSSSLSYSTAPQLFRRQTAD